MLGNLRASNPARIGARSVKNRTAGSIDRSRIAACQCPMIDAFARFGRIKVGQSFPPFADADHVSPQSAHPVDHGLDHRVRAWDISPAGENTDIIFRGHFRVAPDGPYLANSPSRSDRRSRPV